MVFLTILMRLFMHGTVFLAIAFLLMCFFMVRTINSFFTALICVRHTCAALIVAVMRAGGTDTVAVMSSSMPMSHYGYRDCA